MFFDTVLAAEYKYDFVSLLNWRFWLIQWTFQDGGPIQ